jgi:Flp pilus assembly protein TadG
MGKAYSIGLTRQAMRLGFGSDRKRLIRGEGGAVAVEFAIILPILVLLVFGIIDFGHAWYIKQIVTNASREGARYGTRYTGSTASTLTPSISDYILNTSAENGDKGGLDLKDQLQGCNPTVPTPTGLGYTNATPGNSLYVTVTATKTWWIVNRFVPGLGETKTVSSTTCMAVE